MKINLKNETTFILLHNFDYRVLTNIDTLKYNLKYNKQKFHFKFFKIFQIIMKFLK